MDEGTNKINLPAMLAVGGLAAVAVTFAAVAFFGSPGRETPDERAQRLVDEALRPGGGRPWYEVARS